MESIIKQISVENQNLKKRQIQILRQFSILYLLFITCIIYHNYLLHSYAFIIYLIYLFTYIVHAKTH